MSAPVGRAVPDVAPLRAEDARPRPAQGFGGLLDGAVAENAAPRAGRPREKKPVAEAKGTERPDAAAATGGAFAALAALAALGAPPAGSPRPAEGSVATAPPPSPGAVATAAVNPGGEADDPSESPPDAELPPADAELASTAEPGADAPDLAAHLDTLGVKVEVVGLSTAPSASNTAPPTVAAATPVDLLSVPADADTGVGDVAAALDQRVLSARDGITVRVADGANPWEIDVAREDNALSIAVRADSAVRSVIATEEASIRAAAARDGYHLGRIDLAERVEPTVNTVRATAESAHTSTTGSNLSHENAESHARREELPTWPLPRRALSNTNPASTAGPRAGRLDRDA